MVGPALGEVFLCLDNSGASLELIRHMKDMRCKKLEDNKCVLK